MMRHLPSCGICSKNSALNDSSIRRCSIQCYNVLKKALRLVFWIFGCLKSSATRFEIPYPPCIHIDSPRTGNMECAVLDVVSSLLTSAIPFGHFTHTCSHCNITFASNGERLSNATFSVYPHHWDRFEPRPNTQTSSECMHLVLDHTNGPMCQSCHHGMSTKTVLEQPPPLFALEIQPQHSAGQPTIAFERHCALDTVDGGVRYSLVGIVYAGGRHFTCRYFARDQLAWYHDGADTGRSCILDRDLDHEDTLLSAHGRDATLALYAIEPSASLS